MSHRMLAGIGIESYPKCEKNPLKDNLKCFHLNNYNCFVSVMGLALNYNNKLRRSVVLV